MTPQPPFDPLQAEMQELNLLLDRGTYFTVPKRSLLRHLGSPERRFTIYPSVLHTLDALSEQFIKFDFDEAKLKANPLLESRRLFGQNPAICARIVAIAILNRRWKINLFAPLLAWYLADRVTPAVLFGLVMKINQISNPGDFTNSIRYLYINRTTAPALIEIPEKVQG